MPGKFYRASLFARLFDIALVGSGGHLSYGAVMVTQPCLCACCVSYVKLYVRIGKVF